MKYPWVQRQLNTSKKNIDKGTEKFSCASEKNNLFCKQEAKIEKKIPSAKCIFYFYYSHNNKYLIIIKKQTI